MKDDRSLKQVKNLWRRGAGLVKTTDRGKDHEEVSREGGERGPELGMRGGLTRAEAQRKTTVENEEKRKVGIENKGEVKVENKMSSKVEGKLRGRILVKPKEQMWMLQRVKVGNVSSSIFLTVSI